MKKSRLAAATFQAYWKKKALEPARRLLQIKQAKEVRKRTRISRTEKVALKAAKRREEQAEKEAADRA